MKLIVGLRNPGTQYEKTRHNIGFRIVEKLARKYGAVDQNSWQGGKFAAEVYETSSHGEKVLIATPHSFMNLSGDTISKMVTFYKLNPEKDLLVIADDKDMLFGKLRERSDGSSGGHNGLKSVIERLGTEKFHRLKFGVGHVDQQIPTDAFVLQNFSDEEEQQLPKLLDEAVSLIETWLDK